jgi:hypothetical protein
MSGEPQSVDPGAAGQTPARARPADLPAEASAQAGPQEVTQLLADWGQGDRANLGNGDHYDVKINFELNIDGARE